MQNSLIFPLIFVVLWASAFATGSMVTHDATPFAALALRFCLVTVGFLVVAGILREFSRFSRQALRHGIVTGVLFHGLYLGGCWYSFSVGIPAGVSALIVGTQPILTAIFAGLLLGEHVSGKNWIGLALGFVGAVCRYLMLPLLRPHAASSAVCWCRYPGRAQPTRG